jgi:hypothetical protein
MEMDKFMGIMEEEEEMNLPKAMEAATIATK